MTDFLAELGVEELPAGYVEPALSFLVEHAEERLEALSLEHGALTAYATPRRLALHVAGLPDRAPDREEVFRGPSCEAAFDPDGTPRKAAEGFAKSRGLRPADLEIRDTGKGRYVFAVVRTRGEPVADLLAALLRDAVPRFPWPKSMRWGAGSLAFARPLRYVFARFGAAPVDPALEGVPFRDAVRAHPFLHGGEPWIPLPSADREAYVSALRERHVWVDHRQRRSQLSERVRALTEAEGGVFGDEELLDEVTHLLEVPVAAVGSFPEDFLSLPAPVLEAAMTEHQRYFPVRAADGTLRPRFVVTVNRTGHLERIVRGNERVLNARLWDARFFYEEDRRTPLAERAAGLADVMYLKGGGTLADKTERLAATARRTAGALGLDAAGADAAERAARLAKADLLTEMVGEFPSLQGTMGRLYAEADGEPPEVCRAIEEHYLPRGQGDALPATPAGRALSLADRFQTLADGFALGLRPSGSKDPYGLRRCALGVLRILGERGGSFDMGALLSFALDRTLPGADEERKAAVEAELAAFFRERIYQFWVDAGRPFDLVGGALDAGFLDYGDFLRRLDALEELRGRPWWPSLVELAERTWNITRGAFGPEGPPAVRDDLLAEPAEKDLAAALSSVRERLENLLDAGSYVEAAELYHEALGERVHRFFEEVFVNVDEAEVKANRLALLDGVSRLVNDRVARLAEAVTGRREGEEGA